MQVIINGNSTGMVRALNQGVASARTFSASMTAVGRVATSALRAITVGGFAAAGFAIAKFVKDGVAAAAEFNRSMTQIAALTNTSARRVDNLTETIMNLARETGQAPADLAHSMYFLASAGLTVSQQMETLEATAKGAAVSLGSAGDLAKISANALNVFADNGLQASQVMDVLVAAVREGTAEPDEFAQALGRVLPIADKAGISFQQVAASLATMSNAGLKVNLGVTSLRALLQSLVAPTNQTRDAFQSIGLTVDDVVASFQQNGLIATLRMLDALAKKNTDTVGEYNITMRNLIPNIRGLTGAFNLTGQQAKEVDRIFQDVLHSTGSLQTAFEITAESPSFKMQQAMNEIRIAGQNLGTAILPLLASTLQLVAGHMETAVTWAVRFALALVALKVVTSITSALTTFNIALQLVALEMTKATTFSPWGVLLVAIGAALLVVSKNSRAAAIGIGAVVLAVGAASQAFNAAQARAGAFALATWAVFEAYTAIKSLFNQVHTEADKLSDTILKGAKTLMQYHGATRTYQSDLQEMRTGVDAGAVSLEEYRAQQVSMMGEQKHWNDGIKDGSNIFSAFGGIVSYVGSIFDGTQSAWAGFNEASEQVTATIAAQNQQILRGTPLYGAWGGLLDSTSNTSLQLHNNLATLLRDFYVQNGSLQELDMRYVMAKVAAGELGKAIHYVEEELGGVNQALQQAAKQSDDTNSTFANYRATLDSLAKALGTTSDKLLTDLQAASTDGKQALDKFINDTMVSLEQWNADVSNSITGVGDVLGTLAEKSNLSADKIHEAFVKAAEDARNFSADLITISKTGGGAGKALASALLEGGPAYAALANEIAGSGDSMRQQLVGDFGKILKAGSTAADKLQTALIGPLKDIRQVLLALARHWGVKVGLDGDKKVKDNLDAIKRKLVQVGEGGGVKVHLSLPRKVPGSDTPASVEITADDTQARNVINNIINTKIPDKVVPVIGKPADALADLQAVQDYLIEKKEAKVNAATKQANTDLQAVRDFTIPDKYVNVFIHTTTRSPWPDEALKSRLIDPMRGMGFRRHGNEWQLPATIAIHVDTDKLTGIHVDTAAAKDDLRRLVNFQIPPKNLQVRAETKVAKTLLQNLAKQDLPPKVLKVMTENAFAVLRTINNTKIPDWDLRVMANTEQAWDAMRNVRDYKIPDKRVNVIIHTKSGSPWPDEAIQSRLTDPLKRTGFRKTGDSWNLPLNVDLHSAIDTTIDPIAPPDVKTAAATTTGLRRLISVQIDSRGILKDIRSTLKKLSKSLDDASKSAKTGSGGGGGAEGGVKKNPAEAQKSLAEQIVKMVSKFATPKEGVGVVERVSRAGLDPGFINKAVKEVAAELGKKAAEQYRKLLEALDKLTKASSSNRKDAVESARQAARTWETQHTLAGRILQVVNKSGANFKEGVGVIRKVAQAGSDQKFINKSVKDVAAELGKDVATKYRDMLEKLDKRTFANEAARERAIKDAIAALDSFTNATKKAADAQRKERPEIPKWATLSGHNVPRLPEGFTNIDKNHHSLHHRERHRERMMLRLDRRYMDDQLAYEAGYGRGF